MATPSSSAWSDRRVHDLAIAGALVDLGAVTLVFVAGGAIVIVAAIAGIAWGVPTQMVWPEDETA